MITKMFYHPRGIIFSLHFLIFGIFTSCQDKADAGAAEAVPVREFPVIALETMDVVHAQRYPATIEGIENIAIRAKVDGYIQQIYVDEGQYVRKGQPLFQIESQAMSQSAKAAESNIRVAEAAVNVAQVEVDRLRPLVEKNIISEVQLRTAVANLASAKSRVAQAQSEYQSLQENIGYTRITSPVSGYVGRIPFRQGTLVGRNEAMPLTYVSNIQEVYAYFALNEKDFLNFTKNIEGSTLQEKINSMPPVNFIMANGQVYEHPGKIETIAGQIDTRTGTINFRARFSNPDNILMDGASGLVSIPNLYEDVLVIPLQSTYEMQGRKFVYQVNGSDTLKAKPIDYFEVVDNKVLVSGGIEPGNVILAAGVGNVRDGMIIKPQRDEFSNYIDNITPEFK